jgi:large subunit ribosomal protein L54
MHALARLSTRPLSRTTLARVRSYAKAATEAPSPTAGPSGTSREYFSPFHPHSNNAAHVRVSAAERVRSAAEAGSPLKGLNYLKDQPPILARPDEDYPDWLWRLLDADRHNDLPEEDRKRREISKQRKADIKAKNFIKSR